jgi:hypothetical protein
MFINKIHNLVIGYVVAEGHKKAKQSPSKYPMFLTKGKRDWAPMRGANFVQRGVFFVQMGVFFVQAVIRYYYKVIIEFIKVP